MKRQRRAGNGFRFCFRADTVEAKVLDIHAQYWLSITTAFGRLFVCYSGNVEQQLNDKWTICRYESDTANGY